MFILKIDFVEVVYYLKQAFHLLLHTYAGGGFTMLFLNIIHSCVTNNLTFNIILLFSGRNKAVIWHSVRASAVTAVLRKYIPLICF